MNYCKQIDKYISLYLDELLDDKVKTEFLKHIYECNQCSSKLNEASYVADVCRENQDIQLPDNFSASLHERLLEAGGDKGENKIWTFVHNKRFIASLSTAAVLIVSLLAYNSFPHRGSLDTTSMANDALQVETSSADNSEYGSSENKSAIIPKDKANSTSQSNSLADSSSSNGTMSNNASSNNTVANSTSQNNTIAGSTSSKAAGTRTESMPTAPSKPVAQNPDVTVTFNKSVSNEEENNNQQASKCQDKETASSSNKECEKKQGIDASCYTLNSKNQTDTNQYFLNYAELNLKVSSADMEIEDLREIMKDFNAIELKPVTINSEVENSTQNSTDESKDNSTNVVKSSEESPKYVDYYLPLSSYTELENVATKQFNLKLSVKTDIIKTMIYYR